MEFYRNLFGFATTGKQVTFFVIYLASVIFTFQSLLTAYNSSTYLESFTAPHFVGLIFSAAAFLSIIAYINLPKLLNRIGNTKATIAAMVTVCLCLTIVGLAPNPTLTIVAFVIFNAISPLIYFNIDIYLETLIGDDEGSTGTKRGLILTLMSAAALMSPLAMGYIIGESDDLSRVYFVAAAVCLILVALLIARFRSFYDPIYKELKLTQLISTWRADQNIKLVVAAQFLLQFFYAWAIIYIPLYLATAMDFSWDTIGLVIAAGLLAFVIFEYPIGILADKFWGEKEMMAIGFVLMSLSAAQIFYLDNTIWVWMIVMFVSRTGASLVEVTTESYFFKMVKGHDSELISIFRLTRPLSILIGAMVGSLTLLWLPFTAMFLVLALIMASGAFLASRLVDTR